MNRFEINKYIDEKNYSTFSFINDKKEFGITFCGNLDLYFYLNNFNNEPYFIISKENYIIYEIFDKLYNDIKNCNFFDEEDNKHYQHYKNRYEYKSLFKDNVIEWKCDDYPVEIAPSFCIIKNIDSFIIKFNPCIVIDDIAYQYPKILKDWISIRIRNSGSRYNPFNCIFMKLYNSLCNTPEIDFEQVHIEEYLIENKKILKK